MAHMTLKQLMESRSSVRKFSDQPVARADVEEIITCAGLAPSAINLQPWEYVVTYGQEKERLVKRLRKVQAWRQVSCGPGTKKPLPEKYRKRSKEGLSLMKPKVEKTGTSLNRFVEAGSCSFYGAPIAIIVTIDNIFPQIRYLDVGLSVSYLMLAAREKGLSTCPVGLITDFGDEIKDALNIDPDKTVLLGIGLGYADETSALNNMKPGREPLSEILTWYE